MTASFEEICDREFRFLAEFGFRKVKAEEGSVVFENATTFVSVSMDRDQTLLVFVGRLDHRIPDGLESYSYDLLDVVHVRAEKRPWPKTRDGESDWPEMTDRAKLLRTFAVDVLKGDFAAFEDAQKQVDKRKAEYFRRLNEGRRSSLEGGPTRDTC